MYSLLKGRKKPLTTTQIVSRYYGPDSIPYNGQQIVAGFLRGLRKKAAFNKETWRVCSSPRRGPHAIEWWVE